MDVDLVLDRTGAALAAALPEVEAGTVVIARPGQSRRRSHLYFLGSAGDPRCRWVLKVPHADSRQHDLPSPLTAERQVHALERLGAHLSGSGAPASVPRPVALVPEIGGFVMEHVAGPTLTDTFARSALSDSREMLAGVAAAARLLRALHSLEPALDELVDLAALQHHASARALLALRGAGLPVRRRWFRPSDTGQGVGAGRKVLLHGDFAPENVILAAPGACCLDPDLVDKDWLEHDVVRFLLMLSDAPMFVLLADVPAARRLRRRAVATFLGTYYEDAEPGAALQSLMVSALATRWATRHTDVAVRRTSLKHARQLLLRRHFTRLLDEVASREWPAGACRTAYATVGE